MTKLDKAIKALELFPNITADITEFLLKPFIEENQKQEERKQLIHWLEMARQTYKNRLNLATSRDSAIFIRLALTELEAYIDRL